MPAVGHPPAHNRAVPADVDIGGELHVGRQVAEEDEPALAGVAPLPVDVDVVVRVGVAVGAAPPLLVADEEPHRDVVAGSRGTLIPVYPFGRVAIPVIAFPVDAHHQGLGGKPDLDLAKIQRVVLQAEPVVGVGERHGAAVGVLTGQRRLLEHLAQRPVLVVGEAHRVGDGQVRRLGQDVERHLAERVGGLDADRGRTAAGRHVLRVPVLERAAAAARRLDHLRGEAQIGPAVDEPDVLGRGGCPVPQRIGQRHARIGRHGEVLVRQRAHAGEDEPVALFGAREGERRGPAAVRHGRRQRIGLGVGVGARCVEADLDPLDHRADPVAHPEHRLHGDRLVRDVDRQVGQRARAARDRDGHARRPAAVGVPFGAKRVDRRRGQVGDDPVAAGLEPGEGVLARGVGHAGPGFGRARALQEHREARVRQQVLVAGLELVVLRVLVDVQEAGDGRGLARGALEVDDLRLAARQRDRGRRGRGEVVGRGVEAGDRELVVARRQLGEGVLAAARGGGRVVRGAREDHGDAVQPRAVHADVPADAARAEADAVEGDVRGLAAGEGDGGRGDLEVVRAAVPARDVEVVLAGAELGEGVVAGGVGGGGVGLAVGAGQVHRDALEANASHAYPSGDGGAPQVLAVEAHDPGFVGQHRDRGLRAGKSHIRGGIVRYLDGVFAGPEVRQHVFAVRRGDRG